MADTNLSVAAPVIPEITARQALRDTLTNSFWTRFVGSPDSGAALIQVLEIVNGGGDVVHVPISQPLSGSGKIEEETLEGAEEALSLSTILTRPVRQRHAVRIGDLAQHRSVIDLIEESRMRLSEWGANRLDNNRFLGFTGTALPAPDQALTYTPNVLYANSSATGVDDLVAADKLTVDVIRRARIALLKQGAKPLVGPAGDEFFAMVIGYDQAFDLKGDSAYASLAQDAQVRGPHNPVVSGALSRVDGVVLYEADRVPVAQNANASPTDVASSIIFGQSAFCEAVGANPRFVSQSWDYDSLRGFAYEFSQHARRALESASLQVKTASVGA